MLIRRSIRQTVDDSGISGPRIGGRTLLTRSHVPDSGFVPKVTNFRIGAILVLRLK